MPDYSAPLLNQHDALLDELRMLDWLLDHSPADFTDMRVGWEARRADARRRAAAIYALIEASGCELHHARAA